MFSFFLTPYPDESLYSLVVRYHFRSGNRTISQTMDGLFHRKRQRKLEMLLEQDFQGILAQHTPFYLNTVFMSEEKRNACYRWIIQSGQNAMVTTLGLVDEFPKGTTYLRYCPQCSVADLQMCRESYWHRTHQIPGVLYCSQHGCRLLDSRVPSYGPQKKIFLSAKIEQLFPTQIPIPPTALGRQQGLWLANDLAFLMEHHQRARSAFTRHHYDFSGVFLHLLREMDLVTADG